MLATIVVVALGSVAAARVAADEGARADAPPDVCAELRAAIADGGSPEQLAQRLEQLYPDPRDEEVQAVIDQARDPDPDPAADLGALAGCGGAAPPGSLALRSDASPRGYVVRSVVAEGTPIQEAIDRGDIALRAIPALLQTESALEPGEPLDGLVAAADLTVGQVVTRERVAAPHEGPTG